ncbi:MAG: DUF429 domain-containing protein [Bacteroidota bacterium]
MMPDNLLILGIDAAASDANTGLVTLEADTRTVHKVAIGKEVPISQLLTEWLSDYSGPVMACMDAPLGWPEHFCEILATHEAGVPIILDKEQFFPRITDKRVHQKLGKRPLEVTANYIARTAHRALQLVEVLNEIVASSFKLFLDSEKIPHYSLAETYPAGWLISEQLAHKGYKKDTALREALLQQIVERYSLQITPDAQVDLIRWEHTFDALLCGLCGLDILQQRCFSLKDLAVPETIARKEGWVWFKERK